MHSSNSRSPSKMRAATAFSNGTSSPHPFKIGTISLKKNHSGSVALSGSSKRKRVSKVNEPIRLPEDILTIQAHSCSTPVTELPYLLIAAHIGALPTTCQFYPATSSTHTPLTVFRDMFVMTVDVRGYKPNSIRLSTEDHLIIIECLQSEVPQVLYTQTGTVNDDQYVVDPAPKLNSMPVHTSFNYVQHRVKLPDDFTEEGLKVGMDDVSGHIIITGRLVHNHSSTFPESWNKNKVVVKKSKGPIVNTSSQNLSREDARKLAAWQAVQGKSRDKSTELVNTNLLLYGRKQWLEKEGAKLRAIQHKALKSNIKKLTDLKKFTASTKSSISELRNQNLNQNNSSSQHQTQKILVKSIAQSREKLVPNPTPGATSIVPKTPVSSSATKLPPAPMPPSGNDTAKHAKDSGVKNDKAQVKTNDNRGKDHAPTEANKANLSKKKSKVESDNLKKKSLNKVPDEKNNKDKMKKKSKAPSASDDSDKEKKLARKRGAPKIKPDSATTEAPVPEVAKVTEELSVETNCVGPSNSEAVIDPKVKQDRPELEIPSVDPLDKKVAPVLKLESEAKTPTSHSPSSKGSRTPVRDASPVPGSPKQSPGLIKEARTEIFDLATNHENYFLQNSYPISDQTQEPAIGQEIKNETSLPPESSSHNALTKPGEEQKLPKAGKLENLEEIEDPVGTQDKQMWEELLTMAASRNKRAKSAKSPSRSPKPES